MMCPVCKRDLAPTLSICLTCGAMMNDTVREDLQSKIASVDFAGAARPTRTTPGNHAGAVRAETAMPPPVKIQTSDLTAKQTSPTLVDFQTKNATLPDWRLQLQNSIRQRNSGARREETSVDAAPVAYKKQLVSNGANALKAEYIEDTQPAAHENTKVANALRRIEESRRAFFEEGEKTSGGDARKLATNRNYPFNVVSRSADIPENQSTANEPTVPGPKPRLVSSLRIEKRRFDTNKLGPLPESAKSTPGMESIDDSAEENSRHIVITEESHRIELKDESLLKAIAETEQAEIEELDDLAPIATRFNAGLFDLIVGGFASFILMSPFFLAGGDWMSSGGILAFAAVFAVVMFVYLTTSLSFAGRTFGMRIFSLELIDAEENAYPTLHQAAVNSSVYLLSLAAGGLGLLPIFFNEEKRAAHDLASGTILVREF